jgi:ABC-type branched-subunit amino acid transport system substrate-binding protein
MSALIRIVVALVAIFTLAGCTMIETAMAPAVPTPTFIPIPTRSGTLTTPMVEACALAGELKLGAVVSLTGAAASYGTSIQQGMDLAIQ